MDGCCLTHQSGLPTRSSYIESSSILNEAFPITSFASATPSKDSIRCAQLASCHHRSLSTINQGSLDLSGRHLDRYISMQRRWLAFTEQLLDIVEKTRNVLGSDDARRAIAYLPSDGPMEAWVAPGDPDVFEAFEKRWKLDIKDLGPYVELMRKYYSHSLCNSHVEPPCRRSLGSPLQSSRTPHSAYACDRSAVRAVAPNCQVHGCAMHTSYFFNLQAVP